MDTYYIDVIMEDHLRPYVEPLGTLVICCARAEMNLLNLIGNIRGQGNRDALSLIGKGRASVESVITSAKQIASETKIILVKHVNNFYDGRQLRNRYIHDDYAPGWDEDKNAVVVVTVGCPKHAGNEVLYQEPTVNDIASLAHLFAEVAHAFDWYASEIAFSGN